VKLSFSGHQALILGGSCDLATCLARSMVQSELFPVLTFRSKQGSERISAQMASFSGKYKALYFDLAQPESIDSLFSEINDDVDFLVDFAQGDMEALIGSVNIEEMERYFSQNVSSRARVLRKTARLFLRKKRGRLIFISSTAAQRANPGQGFYAAAKSASEALYRNLGLELADRGITTVTLRAGYIDSGRGRDFIQVNKEDVLSKVPISRPITCDEVAETVLFFLSESSRGFNATEIVMDGGLVAGK